MCFFSGYGRYISSSKAFIFSLKNYQGSGYFKRDITSGYYAMYSYYYYGPIFGSGHDIYVSSYANRNYNSRFSCSSYYVPNCDNYVWTGSKNFSPDEIEVYRELTS